jgi:uncharacterized delta-60 repeat protein
VLAFAATGPGTLDTLFNGAGHLTLDSGANDYGTGVAIDRSGNIVVAGFSWTPPSTFEMGLWRFLPDGTPDSSFSGDGYASFGSGSVFAVGIDGLGNIVAAGRSPGPGIFGGTVHYMTLWRYKPDGILDTMFNGVGFVKHNLYGGYGNDIGRSLFIDTASNTYVVAGESENKLSANPQATLWRFDTDGNLDTLFNGVGFVVPSTDWESMAFSVINDPTNSAYVVAGKNTPYGIIWRINEDGTQDALFNGVGFVTHSGGATFSGISDVLLDPASGDYVASGIIDDGVDGKMTLWQFNADGTLDTMFNGVGFVTHMINSAVGFSINIGMSIEKDTTAGKYIVAGTGNNESGWDGCNTVLWRFNEDGTLDTVFNGVGFVAFDSGYEDVADEAVLDGFGNIVVAGRSDNGTDNDLVIWRYRNMGLLTNTISGSTTETGGTGTFTLMECSQYRDRDRDRR